MPDQAELDRLRRAAQSLAGLESLGRKVLRHVTKQPRPKHLILTDQDALVLLALVRSIDVDAMKAHIEGGA